MRNKSLPAFILSSLLLLVAIAPAFAQVASVEFGKNRIQYGKYSWRFYQTPNFNIHFTEGGLDIAKYVLMIAEEELPQIEAFTETALQRKANIVLYNTYDDAKTSNIGLGLNIPTSDGNTELVNNKMILYFNSNHADLRIQIRRGIARILVANRMMGENIGEMASNATLLDLPKWLTDGYIGYVAQPWSVELDDGMKNLLLANNYRNFYQLAFDHPELAGHAFWHYIATNYKQENVSYFLYLAILYKNLNAASTRITRMKFKDLLADFMEKETDKYYREIRGRRNYPRGSISLTEDVNKDRDFYHFAPNPDRRSYTYAVAEYKKGFYNVVIYENYVNRKVLIKNGIRQEKHERNPLYPVMSWDGKGTRLAIVHWEKGKVMLKVYDTDYGGINVERELPFEQVQDAQYFLDHKQLILSAVKNGQSDIFIYNIENDRVEQITNDRWDDLDGSLVSFPRRTGIIFSSNRPTAYAPGGDTTAPSDNRYNIFMADLDERGGFRQISQMTDLDRGNARYPTQYNFNHFTFVSDANGIGNRYAGFFTTQAEGLDTLVIIGDEILRNPSIPEIDSTLRAWERTEPDSVGFIALNRDSTYTFPITNYQSSLLESRIAGDQGVVSEVTRQSDFKMLYRLRVDSLALRRRNVTARPTEWVKQQIAEERRSTGGATYYGQEQEDTTQNMLFFNEFINPADTAAARRNRYVAPEPTPLGEKRAEILSNARLFKYNLRFSNDQIVGGITNTMMVTRYQPYAGGSGPVYMNNGNRFSWLFMASLSDVMEDYRITGAFKPGANFSNNEYILDFQNYRRRIDWGLNYYRAASDMGGVISGTNTIVPLKAYTNRYQANISYPFDEARRVTLIAGYRNERLVVRADLTHPETLLMSDTNLRFANLRAEYVYDNTLNKALNIWHGLRYKFWGDNIMQMNKVAFDPVSQPKRQFIFNLGADARYYLPIYRNFIWATRGAADFSWGKQKILYYLGGADGWLFPKFNDGNRPDPQQNYIYQTLALQMRGYNQNLANGNNSVVFNSELRLPVFSTLLNRPINNAFLRNFQLTQFIDLGTAWAGEAKNISRPGTTLMANNDPTLIVRMRAGGIGPFAGGYGFGVRSTLFGYLVKLDAGWPMNGFFHQKPIYYLSLGLDF